MSWNAIFFPQTSELLVPGLETPIELPFSFPGSLAYKWQTVGLLSLRNCLSQFLSCLFLLMSMYFVLVLFLWGTLTNMP